MIGINFNQGTVMGIMALDRDMQKLAADFAARGGFREPLTRCRDEVMIPTIRRNFEAQGRPEMWEPIGEFNHYRTQRGAGGAPILQPTGAMARTAQKQARFHIADNKVDYGHWPSSSAHRASKYGYVHDMGGTSPFGPIPARPFAILQQQDISLISDVFAEWAQERAAANLRVHYGGI